MHGRHLPPDHSKGDANTLGGYMAVHDRPAAFGGADGYSYSAEILADATGDAERPFGAYLLFVRWARIGAASPAGHLESAFVAYGDTADDAVRSAGALTLSAVKHLLDELVAAASPRGVSGRRWWDAMRAEDAGAAGANDTDNAGGDGAGEGE